MKAFFSQLLIQWKMDFRNKEIVIVYYAVPLIFFLFMGTIFARVLPDAKANLATSMTIFAVTMGAYLGSPSTLIEIYRSDIKRAYQVSSIPLVVPAIVNFISAFVHLLIVSFIIAFSSPLIFGVDSPGMIYFLTLPLFLFACLCIATALGLFMKTNSQLTMAGQLLFLPSILLSGIMLPPGVLPSVLDRIGMVFPATWGYQMMGGHAGMWEYTLFSGVSILCMILSAWKLKKLRLE